MNTIKERLKQLLTRTSNNENEETESTIISFLDQIEDQFKTDMNKFSPRRTIQFPMVFDIMFCPQDFAEFEQAIPGVLPELIADFYGLIKEKRDKIKDAAINPTNKYWQFCYGPCEYATIDGEECEIARGQVITQASLYSDDIRDASQARGDHQTRQSVTSSRSSLTGKAINLEILRGGMWHSNRTITFDFDPELSQELKAIQGSSRAKKTLATITWNSAIDSKRSAQPFLMKENTITISGPKDNRTNPTGILKIDVEKVEKSHVQIRYSEADKQFQICAFADGVVVDEISIPVSKDPNLKWKPLSNNSEIIIRDVVSVFFKA